ncbi:MULTISPECIES: acetyl-CoA carboxylase biotin carboxyl carrier protein [unclassified Neochlamydia]|uniref:acetyl-CoA carboxylase biotin carboxyl carrier protein n=1 Tax=unclassified Neochlamydia TaxID=2643326 RepID=UPI00057D480B|nr:MULTISPECIES: acetyl-CoA carboxylase biotin carboxyl carrier protein [unclassified Neochlamydia]BBI18317.1 Putative biotin carboxyl carrier protein of acetyl-CoA carboxylase [Neochlamydia sp. S13]
MELKQIKELMGAMGRTGTKRVTIKKEGFEIEIERYDGGTIKVPESMFESPEETFNKTDEALRRANISVASLAVPPGQAVEHKEDANTFFVTSPMVGTFYNTPSPEEPPFVKVGSKIDKNSVVCIIEAMKVMNEIKAGATGTVAEVLVENGHPVEFGTKLFRIT